MTKLAIGPQSGPQEMFSPGKYYGEMRYACGCLVEDVDISNGNVTSLDCIHFGALNYEILLKRRLNDSSS